MKIYISYFAQMRHFPKNAIPFSTAAFNPTWYTGLSIPELVMPQDLLKPVYDDNQMCRKNCPYVPESCRFMQLYYKYLQTVDFDYIMNLLLTRSKAVQNGAEEPFIILLVFEPATCKCAERPVLQRWFKDHGVELAEWQPPAKNKFTALF